MMTSLLQNISQLMLNNFWIAPLLALLAGVLTSFTPCSLSSIPLVIGYVGGAGAQDTKMALRLSYGQIHSKINTGTHLSDELLRYVRNKYLDSHPASLLSEGDIVIADTSEDLSGLGNAVLMDRQDKVFAGYHTIILHPDDTKISKFLSYLFKSEAFRLQLRIAASGIKVFSVTQRMLRACTIILPPEKIRDNIIEFLDEQCSSIDKIIAEKELLIRELEAYKQSLIYEVVTGKRKVCNP